MRTYLCRLDEIPDGAARGFDSTGMPRRAMFVVRRGDRMRGWLDACPHVDGAPLAWRKDAYLSADRNSIACYGHGAVFDIDTGVCTKGPCVGQALTPVTLECDEKALWITSSRAAK
ncbi:Rieske 2Fe-2S domain-containing protein [Variovorax sp. VRV01]|uniref:Rieske (2Fe-2S) protein n=1 Tax=Variovorax sp. VRV01 TaxID=2769259 RepID=UPI0017816641|nr:Rieske 2Fe-2S domain-containing protein [Variovorax sp. VRV01]MBD9665535.1 Rieske 2Fe-2S domain-containing protein [Variovorax sp. VRV01]